MNPITQGFTYLESKLSGRWASFGRRVGGKPLRIETSALRMRNPDSCWQKIQQLAAEHPDNCAPIFRKSGRRLYVTCEHGTFIGEAQWPRTFDTAWRGVMSNFWRAHE